LRMHLIAVTLQRQQEGRQISYKQHTLKLDIVELVEIRSSVPQFV